MGLNCLCIFVFSLRYPFQKCASYVTAKGLLWSIATLSLSQLSTDMEMLGSFHCYLRLNSAYPEHG